jgi:hypothetical protein
MISEATFARDFSSFWRLATPMMEGFIRRLNRGTYQRDFPPMTSATTPDRRAFINELAFTCFCIIVSKIQSDQQILSVDDLIKQAAATVHSAAMRGHWGGDYKIELLPEETEDAKEQISRLQARLFCSNVGDIKCRPRFAGCGIIDHCEGDVIVGNILFEIKAGDRLFRSIDIRQILTYLALNHASRAQIIQTVGLINPRVGISVEIDADEFCFEVSGRDAGQLLEFMSYIFSSGDISR